MSSVLFVGGKPADQGQRSDLCKDDWLPPGVPGESYIFHCESLPSDTRLNATVANGHLGTAVFSDKLFVNGVYSGKGNQSRRVAIPQWHKMSVSYISPAAFCKRTYSLDTIKGLFTCETISDAYRVSHRIYAHRALPCLLVNEIEVHRADGSASSEIVLGLDCGPQFSPQDIIFEKATECESGVSLMIGKTKEAETERSYRLPVYCYYTDVPATLVLPDGAKQGKWIFLLTIAINREEALSEYRTAEKYIHNGDQLLSYHTCAWADLWRDGRIDVFGDSKMARAVYGCLYYIMSSLPARQPSVGGVPFFGLSPESLAYGDGTLEDYMGHVFWDQETWMFPPVLMLHANLARVLLSTRTRVIAQAAANAMAAGERGLRYPWEQAFTGVPTSPSDACEKYQLHVNGDISLALEQYAFASNDATFFTEGRGLDLTDGLSEFWQSRLILNQASGQYEIHDVMPPDEYHWPVNNSAYTNEVAKKAITLPYRIRQHFGILDQSDRFRLQEIADKVYTPFDSEHEYIPEFDQYDYTQAKFQTGAVVKQADVILLQYPLLLSVPEKVLRNNLEIYERVTSPRGPAMTWSMFAICHMQMGNSQKASELFNRQYDHVHEPFQVWCEEPQSRGAVNFITGMGGFLQAVIFGYFGVRLQPDRLIVDPQLPPDAQRISITGLDYRGQSLDIAIEQHTVIIVMTTAGLAKLTLQLSELCDTEYTLSTNVPVTVPRRKMFISAS